jgi:hypothetical protein
MTNTVYVINIWDIQWDTDDEQGESVQNIYWDGDLPESIEEYELDVDSEETLNLDDIYEELVRALEEDYGTPAVNFQFQVVYWD